jgi:hypothetical protein
MFFSQNFSFRLNWNVDVPLCVSAIRPENKKQIADGLKLLSHKSIRNRFQGGRKSFTESELNYLTNLDGINHYALGIEEAAGERRGIAIIRMVRSYHDVREAEVAVTIIDEYQRMGLGGLLMDLIFLAALERNLDSFTFIFLPQNEGIVKLINKLGTPIQREVSADHVELVLELKQVDQVKIKARVALFLPAIA